MPENDEAVSPIVGTILMVAIAVVLAGVLFVLVSGIGQTNQRAPAVQFLRDNSNGELTVIKSYRPIDLTKMEVKISHDGKLHYNSNPAVALVANVFAPFSSTSGTDLLAGDVLRFCTVGSTDKVDFVIREIDPQEIVVYQNFFTNLDVCS